VAAERKGDRSRQKRITKEREEKIVSSSIRLLDSSTWRPGLLIEVVGVETRVE